MMNNTTRKATLFDILYSITKPSVSTETSTKVLERLSESNVLDTDEKKVLDEFKTLVNDLGGKLPTPSVLVSENEMYATANTILEEAIDDVTKLFIHTKRKMRLSTILTSASMQLTKSGVDTEDVIEKVSNAVLSFVPNVDELEIEDTTKDEFYENLTKPKERVSGVKFGIDCVDNIYRGILPKSINIIAGYTGSMKTTLTANVCYNAINEGKNVLYFSLEVSKEEMTYSILSRHSYAIGKPIERDKMEDLTQEDKEKFTELYKNYLELEGKFRIIDETDMRVYSTSMFNDFITKTEKDFVENTGHGIDIIVLDHLQLLKFNDKGVTNDPYMVVNFYASYFRQLASKSNYAVILVSQTSRKGYEYACKHGGQYTLTGLAESNELERGGTLVLSIFSSDDLKASQEIQVQVLKNRYGETMAEPQTTPVKPEYYLVGTGLSGVMENVGGVFENGETFEPVVDIQKESVNLDDLLNRA